MASLRSGIQPHQTLRLVLQLKSGMTSQVRTVSTPQGQQLVIDLGDAMTAAPVAAASRVQTPVALRPAHAPADAGGT